MAEKAGFDIESCSVSAAHLRAPASPNTATRRITSQTWTGRGRKPNWLVDAVKKGAKIESFAI